MSSTENPIASAAARAEARKLHLTDPQIGLVINSLCMGLDGLESRLRVVERSRAAKDEALELLIEAADAVRVELEEQLAEALMSDDERDFDEIPARILNQPALVLLRTALGRARLAVRGGA